MAATFKQKFNQSKELLVQLRKKLLETENLEIQKELLHLVSLLESPLFCRLVCLEDSLSQLNDISKLKDIKEDNFDINTNSGELVFFSRNASHRKPLSGALRASFLQNRNRSIKNSAASKKVTETTIDDVEDEPKSKNIADNDVVNNENKKNLDEKIPNFDCNNDNNKTDLNNKTETGLLKFIVKNENDRESKNVKQHSLDHDRREASKKDRPSTPLPTKSIKNKTYHQSLEFLDTSNKKKDTGNTFQKIQLKKSSPQHDYGFGIVEVKDERGCHVGFFVEGILSEGIAARFSHHFSTFHHSTFNFIY
ncbi:hypothetical protein HELRODRAFT_175220 [Helobdella robusta]|uniref:PDZ domain-containing protein n=1 Tax=Helobdella robusta TaxID=6412 RepID=T1F912_HELRO|nr:hypothetical protein HELRODRAFT_175220 [Helobdella robusta]ESO01191.1 hypothetical protein HELRODRAFT_175220 [Helobdella robusta]